MLFLFLSANGPINGLVEKVTGNQLCSCLIQLISERFIFYREFGKESAGHPFFTPQRWRSQYRLYEAANIDGANILQKIWHIDLPALRPVMVISFILRRRYYECRI